MVYGAQSIPVAWVPASRGRSRASVIRYRARSYGSVSPVHRVAPPFSYPQSRYSPAPRQGVSTTVTFGNYQLLDFMSIGRYNQDGTDLLLASIAHVNADVLIAGPRLGYQLAGMPGTRPAPCT